VVDLGDELEARRLRPDEWSGHWNAVMVALDRIPSVWSEYWTKDFIFNAVMHGHWQAWAFGTEPLLLNVIVLTEIIEMPANRFLKIHLAFGNSLDKVMPQIEAMMEKFAILMKCDFCEIIGREGWKGKIRSTRFERHGVVLRARVPKQGVH